MDIGFIDKGRPQKYSKNRPPPLARFCPHWAVPPPLRADVLIDDPTAFDQWRGFDLPFLLVTPEMNEYKKIGPKLHAQLKCPYSCLLSFQKKQRRCDV